MHRNITKTWLPLLLLSLVSFYSFSSIKDQKSNTAKNNNFLQKSEELGDTLRIVKGIFEFPELTIKPSPVSSRSITISDIEKVIDYDVSPAEPHVAALLKAKDQKFIIKIWNVADDHLFDCWTAPAGFTPNAIAWHPLGDKLFILGTKDAIYQIIRLDKVKQVWVGKIIFSSPYQLKRLVPCPRPFVVEGKGDPYVEYYAFRLFFGMKSNNTFIVASITEDGHRFYQAIGPSETMTKIEDEVPPSEIKAEWAMPLSFHPGGHELIWEDKNHNFNIAEYDRSSWSKSRPLANKNIRSGTITSTPNGLGFIHWQKDKSGIGVILIPTGTEDSQLHDFQFITTPSSVPDGNGIVGLTRSNELLTFNYLPIKLPLADVHNAWMFAVSPEEINNFDKDFGCFRTSTDDQLYELYDTENYRCGGYDRSSPTRPYLITTDIFWELFASAYEGIFIVAERDQAIPNFWKFVESADQYYKKSSEKSAWASVFASLTDLQAGNKLNPEVGRILKAQGVIFSDLLQKDFDYSELKPRSHYTSNESMQKYFMAFKYLTSVCDSIKFNPGGLSRLPMDIQYFAQKWIEAYSGFISSSRSPLAWRNIQTTIPSYNKKPKTELTLFPLSWGFDNEVLYSTVYHEAFPPEEQVKGPGGFRLLPSGLDLAAAVGNGLAEEILKDDYGKFPPLRGIINKLKDNFRVNVNVSSNSTNLYDRWLTALAVQWADSLHSPNNDFDKNLWKVKRLQTGLASWATLRHATALVNERSAAECGEGAFEPIILRAPRGYVEPDPGTLNAISGLFEAMIQYIPKSTEKSVDVHESYEEGKGSLYEGITLRLKEMIKTMGEFKTIAEKERTGKELTPAEYEKILYIGRVAEHYFLIFKSLSNPEYALSTPDPMPKIADVAGSTELTYLCSAVGKPLEWDYIIPYYGRHEIAKGSIYSYYEFSARTLLNDKEWREKLNNQPILPWIKPFVIERKLTYPPATGY